MAEQLQDDTRVGEPEPSGNTAGAELRSEWAVAKPGRHDYAAVVTELNASRLVGAGSFFEPGAHVPITHMGYFKPPGSSFFSELRAKDCRSAKEWEYINGSGGWLETGLASLELARDGEEDVKGVARLLALAEESFKAAFEVISMRAQYFRDVTENGIDEARQMAYIVEQGHDAVHSGSYRTAREALTGNLETKAAKQLGKTRLQRASGGKKGPHKVGADSE